MTRFSAFNGERWPDTPFYRRLDEILYYYGGVRIADGWCYPPAGMAVYAEGQWI